MSSEQKPSIVRLRVISLVSELMVIVAVKFPSNNRSIRRRCGQRLSPFPTDGTVRETVALVLEAQVD